MQCIVLFTVMTEGTIFCCGLIHIVMQHQGESYCTKLQRCTVLSNDTDYYSVTLAIAVCLYICVTRLMTSVKGLSIAATPDPCPFISLSHWAKLAEASCKQGERKDSVKVAASFIPLSCTPLFLRYKGQNN